MMMFQDDFYVEIEWFLDKMPQKYKESV